MPVKKPSSDKNADTSKTPAKATQDMPSGPQMPEDELARLEKETMASVSRSISVLEVSIETWKASKDKPEDVEPTFRRYMWLRDALAEWETKILKAKKAGAGIPERMALLKEFVDICKEYGQV